MWFNKNVGSAFRDQEEVPKSEQKCNMIPSYITAFFQKSRQ